MNELIHVEMIQEDIDLGDTSGVSCPIARALRRVIKNPSTVYVGRGYIVFGSFSSRVEINTPEVMGKWIEYHDQGIHYPRPLIQFDIDMKNKKIINYHEKERPV